MKFFKSISTLLIILLLAGSANAASILSYPQFQALDDDGNQLVGGCLYSYNCGTTTKAATCADYQCSADNTNPVELDARGEAWVYSDQCFKLALYEADVDGVCDSTPTTTLIWTRDNLQPESTGLSTDGTIVLSLGTDGTDAYFIGDIQANDGTEVLENGTDGTNAIFTGDVTGNSDTATSISLISEIATTGNWITFSRTETGPSPMFNSPDLKFDANTGTVHANVFSGALTGNADTATSAGAGGSNAAPGGDLTAGVFDYYKVGNIVTISWSGVTFSASSLVASANTCIPVGYQPTEDVMNLFDMTVAKVVHVKISTVGIVVFEIRDWAGASFNASAVSGGSVSFVVN